ncbi:hypothetical protein ACIHAA_03345 [Streptomyces sp. NPDC052040]|uniref:hypothetical protein n=1 Tax=Streptomyces sp. NPDC052040 TaxID=3365682 RepID=UPI0037D3DD19
MTTRPVRHARRAVRTVRTVRTVRSVGLVAVAAAAAFSLTACAGGGKSAAAGSETRTAASAASLSVGSGGAHHGARTSADNAPAGVRTGTLAAVAHHGTTPSAAARTETPVRTRTLADGSKAEIYRLSGQRYRAKLVHQGSVYATLETNGRDAGLDANDMFVVLTLGGEVHSWMGGGHQGPGTFHLAGDWTAKVTKIGDNNRYRAQIIGLDGSVDATLDANQHDVGLDANGVYIVLSAGGVISAHM